MAGDSMLTFINLAKSTLECHPGLLDYIKSWAKGVLGRIKVLTPTEWFFRGHGIVEGTKDAKSRCILEHDLGGHVYPSHHIRYGIGEMHHGHAQEDQLVTHISDAKIVLPPLDTSVLQIADFTFKLSSSSPHWPANMYETLLIGICCPLAIVQPWSLWQMLVLVDLETRMHRVQSSSQGDGHDPV